MSTCGGAEHWSIFQNTQLQGCYSPSIPGVPARALRVFPRQDPGSSSSANSGQYATTVVVTTTTTAFSTTSVYTTVTEEHTATTTTTFTQTATQTNTFTDIIFISVYSTGEAPGAAATIYPNNVSLLPILDLLALVGYLLTAQSCRFLALRRRVSCHQLHPL